MAPRGSYLRIADDLRQRLGSDEFPPGSLLPGEQVLARRYAVSRGTVRAALAVLADASLVEVVPGQGRRVRGAASARAAATAWERVVADLRARVRDGLPAATPLPSESALAAEHGVSRNTVRRAYRQLVEEGVVVVRHGVGAFPAPGYGDGIG